VKLFADFRRLSETVARAFPGRGYAAAERARDFRRAFAETPEGERVLAQILVRCLLWERCYVAGDALETARREGMRDVGLWIMETLNAKE
jgi:hypothetical protein